MNVEVWWTATDSGRLKYFVEKYVQVRQIWHGLDRDRTQASTLTDWQPVTWAMAQPSSVLCGQSSVDRITMNLSVSEPAGLFVVRLYLIAFRAVSLTCKGFWFMQCCTLWWHAELLVHCHGGWWWFGISPFRNILTTVFSHIFVRTWTQTLDTVCWDRKFLWNLLCFCMCELNTVNWWGGFHVFHLLAH